MQYRLLALDLDGTLVTSHGGITEAAKQAVWSYIDAGGVVALASGRPTRGLWPAQELRLAQKYMKKISLRTWCPSLSV